MLAEAVTVNGNKLWAQSDRSRLGIAFCVLSCFTLSVIAFLCTQGKTFTVKVKLLWAHKDRSSIDLSFWVGHDVSVAGLAV